MSDSQGCPKSTESGQVSFDPRWVFPDPNAPPPPLPPGFLSPAPPPRPDPSNLGQIQLREIMVEQAITPSALAQALGISRQAVERYLAGTARPTVGIRTLIEAVLGLSAASWTMPATTNGNPPRTLDAHSRALVLAAATEKRIARILNNLASIDADGNYDNQDNQ